MSNPIHQKLSRTDERVFAFHVLYALDRSCYEENLDDVVKNLQDHFDIHVPSDSYAIMLARGVLERKEDLDKKILPHLQHWKLERLGCCTILILRLALWELEQGEVAPHVVINEAVELAKDFGEKDSYKFVNGVLDSLSKALK